MSTDAESDHFTHRIIVGNDRFNSVGSILPAPSQCALCTKAWNSSSLRLKDSFCNEGKTNSGNQQRIILGIKQSRCWEATKPILGIKTKWFWERTPQNSRNQQKQILGIQTKWLRNQYIDAIFSCIMSVRSWPLHTIRFTSSARTRGNSLLSLKNTAAIRDIQLSESNHGYVQCLAHSPCDLWSLFWMHPFRVPGLQRSHSPA